MGGRRKKERRERKELQEQRRQASVSASPSVSSGPSASASALASASLSVSVGPSASASANIASASISSHSFEAQRDVNTSGMPISLGMPISFSVQYLEPSVGFDFQANPNTLSKVAVEEASALGIQTISQLLATSRTNVQARPTFPTVLPRSDRNLNVLQWFQMGHEPFVVVSPVDRSIGFFQQRNEDRDQLRKCREVNNELVNCGLDVLNDNHGASGCAKCDILSAVVAGMKHDSEGMKHDSEAFRSQMEKTITRMEEESKEMKEEISSHKQQVSLHRQQIASLLEMVEDLRKVRRRNVIEKARKKAVLDIGKNLEDVDSWKRFFADNEQAVLDLGISSRLLSLLKKGKNVLHKVVHEAPQKGMADAILSLKEGSNERLQYEEAFQFAFNVNIYSFFSAEDEEAE